MHAADRPAGGILKAAMAQSIEEMARGWMTGVLVRAHGRNFLFRSKTQTGVGTHPASLPTAIRLV